MNYSLIIITLADFKRRFQSIFNDISAEYTIPIQYYEELYDWIVLEALSNIMKLRHRGALKSHFRHDIFRLIFEKYGHSAEIAISDQLNLHNLNFLRHEKVKALVAGDCLLIARGVVINV